MFVAHLKHKPQAIISRSVTFGRQLESEILTSRTYFINSFTLSPSSFCATEDVARRHALDSKNQSLNLRLPRPQKGNNKSYYLKVPNLRFLL